MALQLPLRRLSLGLVARTHPAAAAALTPRAHSRDLSFAPLLPQKPRARARSLAETGGSCAGGGVPACPACEPAAQPACRARPPAARRALRVVCCPPPRGSRPPCPPRDPSCALTCRDVIDQNRTISTRARDENEECHAIEQRCGGETDRVARRLALAKLSRRHDYEREVEQRAAAARPADPPAAAYRLGVERECARATDGCLYTVPRAAAAPAARCGPGRTPPAPRCVELAPDDNCRIRGEARLDPCAHRPRVMIEVDRREATATPPDSSAAGNISSRREKIPCGCSSGKNLSRKVTDSAGEPIASSKSLKSLCSNVRSASTEGLTSRIIKSLHLGGNAGTRAGSAEFGSGNAGSRCGSAESGGGSASCPRDTCGRKCEGSGARHAGDESWCAALPPPAPAPTRCRRPGIADRLRARSAPPCAAEPRCRRKLHTSATAAAGGGPAGSGGLDEMLRKRTELKEAGLGRVVVETGESGSKRAESPGGRLDLPVPPGTERVRVRVSLDGAQRGSCVGAGRGPASRPAPAPSAAGGRCAAPTPAASPAPVPARPDPCRRLAVNEDRCDSWLSIKNIQKKLSGNRRGEQACPPAPPSAACPLPCPAPAAAQRPPAAAPAPVCGGPPRPRDPERGQKKCTSTVILPPDAIVASS